MSSEKSKKGERNLETRVVTYPWKRKSVQKLNYIQIISVLQTTNSTNKHFFSMFLGFVIQYSLFVCLFLRKCRSEVLRVVDNYALLCLDVVWCYFKICNLENLPDAGKWYRILILLRDRPLILMLPYEKIRLQRLQQADSFILRNSQKRHA